MLRRSKLTNSSQYTKNSDMAGDLNLKKSWNPALIKNQKKIWQEEQDKLQEYKRVQEKNKELEKDDEFKNMLKLQHGDDFESSDLTTNEKLKLSKLNWMYEGPPSSDGVVNSAGFIEKEDFTKGKEQVENMLNGSKYVRKSNGSGGTNLAKILQSGLGEILSRSDDPLLIIKQQMKQKGQGDRELNSRGSSSRDKDRSDRHRSSRESRTKDSRSKEGRDNRHSHRSRDSHRGDSRSDSRSDSHRGDSRNDSHRGDSRNDSHRGDSRSDSRSDSHRSRDSLHSASQRDKSPTRAPRY